MAEVTCTCGADQVLIFACSGRSNVGQIANQAAVRLDQAGVGRMFCLAGVASHIPGMVASAKAAKFLIALDGCSIGCAKESLNHAGFEPNYYTVVTELEIAKAHHFRISEDEVDQVVQSVRTVLGR